MDQGIFHFFGQPVAWPFPRCPSKSRFVVLPRKATSGCAVGLKVRRGDLGDEVSGSVPGSQVQRVGFTAVSKGSKHVKKY